MAFRMSMSVSLLAMACANVAANRLPGASVVIGPALTGVLAGVARGSGLGATDLGSARSTWGMGLRWGAVCAAVAAVGYGIAVLVPATRNAVAGHTGSTWARPLRAALVVIPLGTVLPEEVAFRGVLWGLLRRRSGRRVATLVSSALFGVWHVAPALAGGRANQVIDGMVGGGRSAVPVRVSGTVVFTAAAGVLFCELRSRSDSLLAPMLAHWAVNGLGEIFIQLA